VSGYAFPPPPTAIEFLAQEHGNAQFKAKLPYEMIIVGVFSK